jgi:uncharacterized linocin/CFP29 family protein
MDHLRRGLAPVSAAAWEQLDAEAARTLRHFLAARAILDFNGPHGWRHAAEPLGRVTPAAQSPVDGVVAGVRTVQPLIELRTPFELSMAELDAIDRGAPDPDLAPLQEAARLAALAEDRAVFHVCEPGAIAGVAAASPHEPLTITDDYDEYPGIVAGPWLSCAEQVSAGPTPSPSDLGATRESSRRPSTAATPSWNTSR